MRDYGPEFIHADGALGVVDLDYYPGRYYDDVFPRTYARSYRHTVFNPGIYLEGGNFQSDGRGGCFVSRGALEANDNDEERVFEALRSFHGCQRTTVVDYLREEGTHHIDMWMKVVSPTTVLVGDYSPTGSERLRYPDTVNDRVLDRVADQVRAAGYQVVRIPQPPSRESPLSEGYTIVTYTNSTFANDRVLIPVYGLPSDQRALAVYDSVLPREVTEVPIDSDYVIDFGGSVHCITMERYRGP
jgi:agmatine deiminase